MKKVFAILLAMVMVFSLAACSSGGGSEPAEEAANRLEAIKAIAPQQVMVYTIDRETPMKGLVTATHEELDTIRDRVIALGIPCSASY